jgi:hypothetical protein
MTGRLSLTAALCAGLFALAPVSAPAQTVHDEIEVARGVLKADRKAVIADNMQLTEAESKAFWPIYRDYRNSMDKVGDHVIELVLEYAELYPNVPEARAKSMLARLGQLQSQKLQTRAACLQKLGPVLPASKVLRFAQLENRMDLLLDLQMASQIPLMETTEKAAEASK